MPHSYTTIWLHVIFSTKDRMPLISPRVEKEIHDHLREQLKELECPVRIINGMPDHVHLLFLLNPNRAVTDVMKQIKGNTSHWINQENIIRDKFAWQTGYAVYSVSQSQVRRVFQYIQHQKERHAKETFVEEIQEFMRVHGMVD